nr:repressor of yield of DENV protein [Pogona vitticeps]
MQLRAPCGTAPVASTWGKLEKSVRRLREKFYGKVSIVHAVKLMRKFSNNHDLACKFIILCKDEMNDLDQQDEQNLGDDPAALNVMNKLTKEEEQKKQKSDNKNDETVKVARCHKCWKRYDPVPYNKMWGTAEFKCTSCGRTFRGSAQIGTPSPCYSCHTPVFPSYIIPPRKTPGPRTKQQHSCFAEDCFNRREPHIPGTHCVHPISRRRRGLPKVIHPSEEHDSTGSTVATCVSQGSLATYDIDYLILEDLEEQDEEEDGGSSS